MEEEVPCYFLCPISLQMMRDPVTLPTGITYDRDGIERWLATGGGTCPLTKQAVPADCEPTPNHTLRRLIQAWCELHLPKAAAGGDEIGPKKPPTDRGRVAALVSRITKLAGSSSSNQEQLLAGLRELRDVAAESERNRQLVAAVPGAVDALAAVLVASSNDKAVACGGEALEIISSLQLSEQRLARVVETTNEMLLVVDALVSALQRSSRERAARLLADVTAVMPTNRLASLPEQVFREATQLLRDRPSKAATKAALHVLVGATPWGRNRVKAVDAGAVPALVEMLLDVGTGERRVCELALAALERLCGCAEGRAELVAHAGGVAAVGARALRVSEAATDKAVRVLRSVARHAATPAVLQEMAHTGVVAALCLVATEHQFGDRTRDRARETLRLHARQWSTSPCLHHHLRAIVDRRPPPS